MNETEEKNTKPLVSIIIPIYNVEKYLCQCLESIIRQTYTNWECIIVNDGSSDDSGLICEEYIKQDYRCRFFQQENKGVSSARNVGLSQAKGEWLYFVDADDILEEKALETMLVNANKYSFIMAGYKWYASNGLLKSSQDRIVERVITVEEAIKEMYSPSDFLYQGFLWCKLFSATVVNENHLCFNELISFNEDRLFVIQYLCKLKGQVFYTTRSVYNYIEHCNSAMSSLNTQYNRKFSTDFDAYVIMKKNVYAFTENKELRLMAIRGIAKSYIQNLHLMYKFKDYDVKIHWKMTKELISAGAMTQFVKLLIHKIVKKTKNEL